MSVKTNAKKYEHFEFDDGTGEATPRAHDAASASAGAQARSQKHNKKHQSQWDFEDFVTPEKTRTKDLPNNQRHFGWSDDEVRDDSGDRVQNRN